MTFYYQYKKYIIFGAIIILLVAMIIYLLTFNKKEKVVYIKQDETTTMVEETFFVDVKGAVKKPGVYEFVNGDKVIDAINKAGGLSNYATTSNINLSKKLINEMVVYVFKKSELINVTTTKANPCNCETVEVNNCINNTSQESSKININTADLKILTTITGIGDAKAQAIIDYRNENGNFKSIEDIKNVSGFGEAIFAKIKDFITV